MEGACVAANMPVGEVEVDDGLIGNIYLDQTDDDHIKVFIDNRHPAEFKYEVAGELPVRLIINLGRESISELFRDKRIVIDPGHGGADAGGRGPVNLLEKDVVMPIAVNLQELCQKAGAEALLTRQADRPVSLKERREAAVICQADLFVSIHTHADQDSNVGGVAVNYSPQGPESAILAQLVKDGLVRKLKLADRGIKRLKTSSATAPFPAVEVEVVTITNWVEEGLLRSPTVHMKAAEGIFNGVKDYLAGQSAQ